MLTRQYRRPDSGADWKLPPGEEGELISDIDTLGGLGPHPLLVRLKLRSQGFTDDYAFFVAGKPPASRPPSASICR
ncbi:hypothetical protein SAMN04488504_108269 [Myxococcus virescens]|uniref:Uncharacterized protein n=1 Tax=Myxococcus virescens TaxID=83456 RepID=A0ABY0MW67_9BACT|nr:hypothetical protein SAMN04488504_108269 [Myxococcus virescens]